MQFDPQKTVFLIDGSSFLYRAYYSMRPLHTLQGKPVHAIYSFCRMIKKLVDLFSPSYLVIVWDSKGKTVRHEIYTEYKGTRQAPPSDLFEQKDKVVEFASLIGIHQVAKPGIEADDLMYSLAKDLSLQGMTSVLVTSDKDMGQALGPGVLLYDPFKEQTFTQETFEEQKGMPVAKLPFYYALLGDTSDNIPGVKGIGEKTALELVSQFKSLQDMYDHLEQVSKPRIKLLLEQQKDNAFLSEKLFLMHYYSLGLTQDDVRFDVANWANALPLFEELNFKSLLKGLGKTQVEEQVTLQDKIALLQQYEFITVNTKPLLDQLCTEIAAAGFFGCDTETDGLDVMTVNLVGFSVSTKQGSAYYIPCAHKTGEEQLPFSLIVETFKPIFANPEIKKYFHNVKFDRHVLESHDMPVNGIVFDTLIAASLVTKDWQRAGLKFLSVYYFNEQMLSYDDVVKSQKHKNFSFVPLKLATYYAANDAHQTLRLVDVMEKELTNETMQKLYHDIEFPLVDILYRMERKGIFLDVAYLKQLNESISQELDKLEDQICLMAGIERGSINLNSPKQLQELLFVTLLLTPRKKSAKGTGYSTDQEVLLELAKEHPVPALLVDYRELFKLKSTYIEALPTYVNKKTKRIHTTYNQFAVATGRLASSDPNLQNIPLSSTGYAAEIRAAFKPEKGHLFLAADYSQIELRVLAYLSQDTTLLQAFTQQQDIHTLTAAGLFEIDINQVTSQQRQVGKRINFSILYGMTPFGLSKDLGIPYADAKRYIDNYFAQFPGVQRWMDAVVEETKQHGYVTTFWGRRRYVPAIYERNKTLYEEGKRIAINTQGQGTAAEIMKKGMIALDNVLKLQYPDSYILLQIHDELVISVSEAQAHHLEAVAKSTLEKVVDWNVPLQVTTRIGKNWKEVSK